MWSVILIIFLSLLFLFIIGLGWKIRSCIKYGKEPKYDNEDIEMKELKEIKHSPDSI